MIQALHLYHNLFLKQYHINTHYASSVNIGDLEDTLGTDSFSYIIVLEYFYIFWLSWLTWEYEWK